MINKHKESAATNALSASNDRSISKAVKKNNSSNEYEQLKREHEALLKIINLTTFF
jgi:hypothetical protein